MNRVTNIAWRTASGSRLGGFAYRYDALGRIVSRAHDLGGASFDRHLAYYSARDVFDLKTVRKSKDLLRYLYEVTFCSECRRYNLQAMAARRMLTDDLLRECLYDCNEDTRRYAARLLKRRKARRV